MKTKILFLIVIILTITACRKYPEGGSYFLNSIDNEIIGTYNFTHYYIDGKDSVNYYFNPDGKLELGYYKQHIMHPLYLTNYFYDNNNYGVRGEWRWNNKNKKELNFKILYTYLITDSSYINVDSIFVAGPFTYDIESIWDIKKIKNNELIIETDYNNKHYRAELKK